MVTGKKTVYRLIRHLSSVKDLYSIDTLFVDRAPITLIPLFGLADSDTFVILTQSLLIDNTPDSVSRNIQRCIVTSNIHMASRYCIDKRIRVRLFLAVSSQMTKGSTGPTRS